MLDLGKDNTLYVPKPLFNVDTTMPYRGCVAPGPETQHWSFENSFPKIRERLRHMVPPTLKKLVNGCISTALVKTSESVSVTFLFLQVYSQRGLSRTTGTICAPLRCSIS